MANRSTSSLRAKRERGEFRGDEQAYVRLGRTQTRVLVGEDDLSDWTDEELRRGCRAIRRNGRYTGRFTNKKPDVVPKKMHDELVRRTMSKANALLNENLLKAVECLVEIITDPQSENKDRIKAAQLVMDRVMGKAPERIEVRSDAPWLLALQGGIVSVDNEADVIDVEDEEE
jgi:hypothetical protein